LVAALLVGCKGSPVLAGNFIYGVPRPFLALDTQLCKTWDFHFPQG
jgi:hypothetical protein